MNLMQTPAYEVDRRAENGETEDIYTSGHSGRDCTTPSRKMMKQGACQRIRCVNIHMARSSLQTPRHVRKGRNLPCSGSLPHPDGCSGEPGRST